MSRLTTQPYQDLHGAPEVRLTCVVPPVTLAGHASLTAVYTPHKHVVETEVFVAWLQEMSVTEYPTWETFGTTLIDTFYDILLPRKTQFTLEITAENGAMQTVKLVRAQPV